MQFKEKVLMILFFVHEEVEVGVIKSYLLAIWRKRMARMREINRE